MKKEYVGMNANKIRQTLIDERNEYISPGSGFYQCDIACLFVASAYLLSSHKIIDKENFRKDAYLTFLKDDRTAHSKAWDMIDHLVQHKNTDIDKKIKVLKGGTYKIGGYYLENYKLQDMRGASTLLTHVEEAIIPNIISKEFIPECIIYSGGGNIFALVPEECDDSFALQLEEKATEVLISANVAFVLSEPQMLRNFFNKNYKSNMAHIERRLDNRKKLKIFIPESPKTDLNLTLEIDRLGANNSSKKVCIGENINVIDECEPAQECDACKRRSAIYEDIFNRDGGQSGLCASCLHKRRVGRSVKASYQDLFIKYNGQIPQLVTDLSDIDEDYIAILYGDGNNIGGIIAGFNYITQMMEFSRNIKDIIEEIVFTAMKNAKIEKFEVVGLGGDDIFVILEGKKAIKYAKELIDLYNTKLECYINKDSSQKSTLSVGIAISETKMPIQILLEEAETQLKRAKEVAKQQGDNDDGSLSYIILNAFKDDESSRNLGQVKVTNTLLPYTCKNANQILELTKKMKSVDVTRLRNLLDAFERAESPKEANLFFDYLNAKSEKPIILDEIDSYELKGGYYIKDDTYYYIWRDLIYLLKYYE